MDVTPPRPASLDDIEPAPDLEEGFAYTQAAHDGAKAAAEVAGYYTTLVAAGIKPKRAYRLAAEWVAARAGWRED